MRKKIKFAFTVVGCEAYSDQESIERAIKKADDIGMWEEPREEKEIEMEEGEWETTKETLNLDRQLDAHDATKHDGAIYRVAIERWMDGRKPYYKIRRTEALSA